MKRKGFYYENRKLRKENKNIKQIKFGKPTKFHDKNVFSIYKIMIISLMQLP